MAQVDVLKGCSRCGRDLPLGEFYESSTSPDGRRAACKPCTRAASAVRYARNREAARNRRYLARYKLTAKEVDEFRAAQEYRCATCGVHEDELGEVLKVDHCHLTDIFRGMLCDNCNKSLGFFRDSITTLRAFIGYLERAHELIAITDTERD